jgi:predicted ArsR family transcriptional regulator
VLAVLRVGQEVLDDPLRTPKRIGFELGRSGDGIVLHLSETMAVSATEIARKLQLPIAEVLGRLTSLELEGAVKRHGPGYIRALRRGEGRA